MRSVHVTTAFQAFPFSHHYDIMRTMKISDAVSILSALAQESRLEIFRYLIQSGPAGVPAGRIGEQLDVHSATLSFHLNALRHAGLVSARRESRSIIYTANFARMSDLIGYLTENCCKGEPRRRPAAKAPRRTPEESFT
jgi:ArsR family transcriptional regulator, arsenate/arsenite/antimonite-responsive transcriptional repressor